MTLLFNNLLKKARYRLTADKIPESIDIDAIASSVLEFIIAQMKTKVIDLSEENDSRDGRLNSAKYEARIIDFIANNALISEFLKSKNLKMIVPRAREWYDLCFIDSNLSIFIPVNIKISMLERYNDDISSKNGLYYACTGKKPDKSGAVWPNFFKDLEENMNYSKNGDYYFLIINKNDSTDAFFTSLKTINELAPNGNNLPFQCNWRSNRERVKRTHEEAVEFLLDKFKKSLMLKRDIAINGIEMIEKIENG